MSDAHKVINAETASILSGIAESDIECDNIFIGLEEDEEEVEDNETVLDDW